MTTSTFGPWIYGIDQIAPDTDMPKDRYGKTIAAVKDVYNGDIDQAGNFQTRQGLARVLADAGIHSVWSTTDSRAAFGVQSSQLCAIGLNPTGLTVEPIYTLPSNAELDYCELNSDVVFSSNDLLAKITPNGHVMELGAPDAPAPMVSGEGAGGLFEGRYSVAIAWINPNTGEVGGLSQLVLVHVNLGGGIRLRWPAPPAGITTLRLYRTAANGDVLYNAGNVPASMGNFLLGNGELGAMADNQFMRRMTPGPMVRKWRGRLLTARGRILRWSEPLRYGMTDPRHNFVHTEERISFIEPVENGIFIGQQTTVKFLAGKGPGEWELTDTGAAKPCPRSSTSCKASVFNADMQLGSASVAVWLALNGYVVGQNDGRINEPQCKRIQLPVAAAGRTAIVGHRLYTMTNEAFP